MVYPQTGLTDSFVAITTSLSQVVRECNLVGLTWMFELWCNLKEKKSRHPILQLLFSVSDPVDSQHIKVIGCEEWIQLQNNNVCLFRRCDAHALSMMQFGFFHCAYTRARVCSQFF